ncbi:MAG: XRE family transcriptional regulator [Clostridiales bacterium]|nr:XRE family transcriptional regulator [Clostridiales bacterium]
MHIGENIKRMRLRLGLTQEELAARTELSKGFISQLERDLTSPSIATLMDILETLGSDIANFFKEETPQKIVYGVNDVFVKEDAENNSEIRWLVTSAQKNALEPILVTLSPGGRSGADDPHEGEEFGFVLSGVATLYLGEKCFKVKKGESFYFKPTAMHELFNFGKKDARILWVSTPPSF